MSLVVLLLWANRIPMTVTVGTESEMSGGATICGVTRFVLHQDL